MALSSQTAAAIVWENRPVRGRRRTLRLDPAEYEVEGGTIRRRRRPGISRPAATWSPLARGRQQPRQEGA